MSEVRPPQRTATGRPAGVTESKVAGGPRLLDRCSRPCSLYFRREVVRAIPCPASSTPRAPQGSASFSRSPHRGARHLPGESRCAPAPVPHSAADVLAAVPARCGARITCSGPAAAAHRCRRALATARHPCPAARPFALCYCRASPGRQMRFQACAGALAVCLLALLALPAGVAGQLTCTPGAPFLLVNAHSAGPACRQGAIRDWRSA